MLMVRWKWHRWNTPTIELENLPAKMILEIKQTTKFIQKKQGCSVKVDKSYPHNLCINRVLSLKCSTQQLQNITSWRRRTLSSSIGSGRGQFRSWRSWGPTFCKCPSKLAVFIKEHSRNASNCFSIRSTARKLVASFYQKKNIMDEKGTQTERITLHPVKHNLYLFIHLLPQPTQRNDISRKRQFIPEAEKHSL